MNYELMRPFRAYMTVDPSYYLHNRCFFYSSINDGMGEYGFAVFMRDCDPIDYYEDDIIIGTMYTTERMLSINGSCFVVIENDLWDYIVDDIHDPVLG